MTENKGLLADLALFSVRQGRWVDLLLSIGNSGNPRTVDRNSWKRLFRLIRCIDVDKVVLTLLTLYVRNYTIRLIPLTFPVPIISDLKS